MSGNGLTLGAAFTIGRAWLAERFLRRRIPLFLSWNITYKCDLRCAYCGVDTLNYRELSTQECLSMLDGLRRLGTRWITFSGGEPLLRKDLPELIDHAAGLGIEVFISTNGNLVPRLLDRLGSVRKFTLSLDGPQDIHDAVRGPGTFSRLMEAVKLLLAEGKSVGLQCVLSRQNAERIDEVVALSEGLGVWTMYQPATLWLEATQGLPNPAAPERDLHRRAVEKLAEHKRRGARVANSVTGLEHLKHWPEPTDIACKAGRLSAALQPDGRFVACDFDQRLFHADAPNPGGDCESRFKAMPVTEDCCRQCWCAPAVELYSAFSPAWEPVWNLLRIG